MKHLPREVRVALAEGGGAGEDHPHLAACARCRDEVEALREARRAAAALDVPEPSPLFWDHFSQRVADAVSRAARPAAPAPWGRWRLAGSLLAVSALVVAVLLWPRAPDRVKPEPAVASAEGPGVAATVAADGVDEAWGLVALTAESAGAEAVEATGIAPAPGAIDQAAGDLSGAEREELIRLLRSETAEPTGTEG